MSYYGGYTTTECCNEVVNPISLLVTIAAIAVAAAFLRQAVIDNNVMGLGGKRRKKRGTGFLEVFRGKVPLIEVQLVVFFFIPLMIN